MTVGYDSDFSILWFSCGPHPALPLPQPKYIKQVGGGMRTSLLLKRVVDRNHKMENSPYATLRQSSGM